METLGTDLDVLLAVAARELGREHHRQGLLAPRLGHVLLGCLDSGRLACLLSIWTALLVGVLFPFTGPHEISSDLMRQAQPGDIREERGRDSRLQLG
jgi:hypothetical protein